MTLREPSIFFRAMVLGAQGVFYNLFCMSLCLAHPISVDTFHLTVFAYILSPNTCHRFVGHLEEEAVLT